MAWLFRNRSHELRLKIYHKYYETIKRTTTTNTKSKQKSMNTSEKREFGIKNIYLFYLLTLSLMLTITQQILFTIKNSNKMLFDVKTLLKNVLNIKHFI